jgi:polyisoprenoid-binding protein YceI
MMKQLIHATVAFMLLSLQANAQSRFFTKTGRIKFDATVPKSPEAIAGVNNAVICVMDTKNGNIQFSAVMKSFEFKAALMEEHFNENYVESNKFPKAEFRGSVTNNNTVDYAKDGSYKVKVKGNLTMHGETKEVETDGEIIVRGEILEAKATFTAALSDYKVKVPQLVADKVSQTAKIIVECSLQPLK